MAIPFDELPRSDLRVGEVYRGGSAPNIGADPLARLLGVGNQGGIRPGSKGRMVALFTTNEETEWPDRLEPEAGILTYFGDNRTAGQDLHERRGNCLLRDAWHALGNGAGGRREAPPFFVFAKAGSKRDVRFLGLAALGVADLEDDLAAVWSRSGEGSFLNYRARFTLLDAPVVQRAWLDALEQGTGLDEAPLAWTRWVETGVRVPLRAEWHLPGETKSLAGRLASRRRTSANLARRVRSRHGPPRLCLSPGLDPVGINVRTEHRHAHHELQDLHGRRPVPPSSRELASQDP